MDNFFYGDFMLFLGGNSKRNIDGAPSEYRRRKKHQAEQSPQRSIGISGGKDQESEHYPDDTVHPSHIFLQCHSLCCQLFFLPLKLTYNIP